MDKCLNINSSLRKGYKVCSERFDSLKTFIKIVKSEDNYSTVEMSLIVHLFFGK